MLQANSAITLSLNNFHMSNRWFFICIHLLYFRLIISNIFQKSSITFKNFQDNLDDLMTDYLPMQKLKLLFPKAFIHFSFVAGSVPFMWRRIWNSFNCRNIKIIKNTWCDKGGLSSLPFALIRNWRSNHHMFDR